MQNFIPNTAGRVLRSTYGSQSTGPKPKAFSAIPPNDLKFEHDDVKQRFSICLGEDCAVILYKRSNDILDLYHTEVPPAFRGQGVAAFLAKRTFEYVCENNLKMKLSCDYLQKYYKDNKTADLKKILA